MRISLRGFLILFPLLYTVSAFSQTTPYTFPPDKRLSELVIDNWTTDNGLPTNQLNRICQSRDGYLWITSYNGIIRFDGHEFRVFNKENTPIFTGNSFRNVVEDRNGVLWFTSSENGLVAYRNGRFKIYGKAQGITALTYALYIDPDNRLWSAAPGKGCLYLENETFHFPAFDTLFRTKEVNVIIGDRSENMFIGVLGGGVYRINGQQMTHYGKEQGLTNEVIGSAFIASDGKLTVGTSAGLFYLDDGVFREETAVDRSEVNEILGDTAGSIWLATANGIYRRTAGYERLDEENGLPHNRISGAVLDAEGNLWLAHYRNGLTRIKNGLFTNLIGNLKSTDPVINTLCETRDGRVLAGLENGGVYKIINGEVSPYPIRQNTGTMRLRHILEDRHDNLWLSYHGGLLKIDPTGMERWYDPAQGFPGQRVRLCYEDQAENIWAGSRENGLIRLNPDNSYFMMDQANGLSANLILCVAEDTNGDLLVGTDNGLNRLRDGKVVSVCMMKNGLAGNVVFNAHVDSAGVIWLACNGGLSRIENNVITNFTTQNGLAADAPFDIVEDALGDFWLPFDTGIMKVNKQTLNDFAAGKRERIDCRVYNKYNGIQPKGFTPTTQSLRTRDGKIWFPTLNGVVMVDPARQPRNTLPPPVYVEELWVDKETCDLTGAIAIPYGKQRLTVKYTGICLHAPEKMRFRYKLEGFDTDWVETDYRQRSVSYTNLPHGSYTFRVKACNNDGVWNETGATRAFTVLPPWYRTWWAYSTVVIFFLLSGSSIYFWRVNQLQKRQAELEAQIVDKTQDLTQKYEELGLLYQELGLLYEVNTSLISTLDLDALLKIIVESAVIIVPNAEKSSILILNPATQEMEMKASVGYDKALFVDFRLKIEDSFSGKAIMERQSFIINRVEPQAHLSETYFGGNYMKSAIVALLEVKQRIIGTISVDNFSQYDVFRESDLLLLTALATQAAIAIEKAELHQQLALQTDQLRRQNNLLASHQKALEDNYAVLTNAMQKLKDTQAELIHAEKMSALGHLVAGIAHEVNSPLGAILASNSNITASLTETLRLLPRVLARLTPEEYVVFFALVDRGLQNRIMATSREQRQYRRALRKPLEALGLPEPDRVADTLVEMGIYSDIEPFAALLKSDTDGDILPAAFNLVSQQKSCLNIATAVDRASKVVFALRTYAHHDAGGQMQRVPVTDTIETVLTLYHNKLKQGVELSKEYEDTPPILCHPDQLNQVWTNLIHNAIQAMNNKGTLDIKVYPEYNHLLLPESAGKNESLHSIVVAITDSGPGIPAHVKPHIFEPFFTTKPAGEGSGLGLEIVRRIVVEGHKGTIDFDSVPGKTTFRVRLPIN